ncbi:MAG: hypothetical protein EBT83_03330 [Betaproteobacteria bacterium]|jgi:uncharacterized NAD(P)/FAD-binding protein YdhS|nr:hypothetical protein [Betaproteobacteria bacterium]
MKQYDPHKGWVDAAASNNVHAVPTADPTQGDAAHAAARLSDAAPVNAGRAAIFHFSRNGSRIKLRNEEPEAVAAVAAEAVPEAAQQAWPSASSLMAVSGAVKELFATLSEDENLSPQVADVVDSMRCLAAKIEEKTQLENELAAVNAQIVIVEQVLHRHVRAAHDSEIKALATRQARVELMRELANCILDNKDAQKPA